MESEMAKAKTETLRRITFTLENVSVEGLSDEERAKHLEAFATLREYARLLSQAVSDQEIAIVLSAIIEDPVIASFARPRN